METTIRLGYVRLSKDDAKSLSIENQKKDLMAYDPAIELFVDQGVSGEHNLTKADGAWAQLWSRFLEDPAHTEVCVVAFDRVGRKQGKVLSVVEDMIDLGGALVVVNEGRRYEAALDDVTQDISLTFQSFSNAHYRKEVQRKTLRGLGALQEAGVTLGPPPKFREREIAQVRELHERGLGYVSIGKVVRVARKDGTFVNTSPRVVKRILSGEYQSRESWERQNAMARLRMAENMAGGANHE